MRSERQRKVPYHLYINLKQIRTSKRDLPTKECGSPSLLLIFNPPKRSGNGNRKSEIALGNHERAKRSNGSEQAMMVTPVEACSETLFRWPI